MGKSTISMAIFNSYAASLTEGIPWEIWRIDRLLAGNILEIGFTLEIYGNWNPWDFGLHTGWNYPLGKFGNWIDLGLTLVFFPTCFEDSTCFKCS